MQTRIHSLWTQEGTNTFLSGHREGNSGFADSNTFPLDTTNTGQEGIRGLQTPIHSLWTLRRPEQEEIQDLRTPTHFRWTPQRLDREEIQDLRTPTHFRWTPQRLDREDSNNSGFADSNTFPLDTTETGTGNSGFAESNTFSLDITETGPGGNSGFADSNTFSLDTTSDEQNATVSGFVNYDGVIPGPAIVWARDDNNTLIDQVILPDGNGSYTLSVPLGKGYDFKVFIDGTGDGNPQGYEVWKHHGDWNSSINGFNLTQVDGNLTGINFNLFDTDNDNDGFLNWHEYLAGTQENNASSYPVTCPYQCKLPNSGQPLVYRTKANATATYGHISDWNTSAVTNMSEVFWNRNTFNENISDWDTSSVTSMRRMFQGATSFNQPIGDWNTVTQQCYLWGFYVTKCLFIQPTDWELGSIISDKYEIYVQRCFFIQPTDWELGSIISNKCGRNVLWSQ